MRRVLFLGMLALSCTKEDKGTLFYTMEAYDYAHDSIPPPLPLFYETYYSAHNIVIDSLGDLYYFKHQELGSVCATGFYHDSIYPASFISLSPNDLVLIPKNGIEKFIRSNITDSLKLNSSVNLMVGSARDSFYSKEFSKIALVMNDKSGNIILRRITQEEEVVLDYKKKKIDYNPQLINWDSKRTEPPIFVSEIKK